MNRLRSWLLVILWAALIFTFSADSFSREHTATVILPVLHWLLPRASDAGTIACFVAPRDPQGRSRL